MKLRADLKLVKQLDYVPTEERDMSYCTGCVFYATRMEKDSMCERVNALQHTCRSDMIYVIDEEQWNSYEENK